MNRITRSLTAKLIIGVMMIALSVYLVTAGLLFLQSRNIIRSEAKERAASVLNTALHQVRKHMNLVETATNANAWIVEENYTPQGMMDVAQRIVRLNRNVYGCTIAASENAFAGYGRHYSVYTEMEGDSLVSEREPVYDYFSEAWYKKTIELGSGCWADLYREDTKGMINLDRTLAVYSRPIYRNGEPAGVVSAGLSFRKLSETLYSVDYPYDNAYFVVLGADGRYLLHPDTTKLFRKTVFSEYKLSDAPDVIALGHEMTAGNAGVAHLNINGKQCHVSYSPIPGTDWSLALICPTTDVLENYHRMVLFVVIIDLLGVLLIVVLCRWGVHRVLSPIWDLVGMANLIAAGKYSEELPMSSRKDAVGNLQNAFAAMQRSIKENLDGIRATNDEITRHNKELANATKMAEEALQRKNTFLANVMHQIRTPINIIQGFAQVMRDMPQMDKGELKEITYTMKHNSHMLSRMVMMLYDSSETREASEPLLQRRDQVPCNLLARECIDFTNEHFPDIPIKFDTELDDSAMILTNHLYLMRTVRELLYNAAKYSDGKNIRLIVSQEDHKVLFTVEDTGPGLPRDSMALNFEFFTKQDDLSEGLGLGLPLTKRHAINLGGDLTYDKSYKDGARFIVSVPR